MLDTFFVVYSKSSGIKLIKPTILLQTYSPSNLLFESDVYVMKIFELAMKLNSSHIFGLDALVNLLKPTGYVMHQQFNIQQLYALPTLYLCVLYLSENKQRLVPLTA